MMERRKRAFDKLNGFMGKLPYGAFDEPLLADVPYMSGRAARSLGGGIALERDDIFVFQDTDESDLFSNTSEALGRISSQTEFPDSLESQDVLPFGSVEESTFNGKGTLHYITAMSPLSCAEALTAGVQPRARRYAATRSRLGACPPCSTRNSSGWEAPGQTQSLV